VSHPTRWPRVGRRIPSGLWASAVSVDADRGDRRLTVSTAIDPVRGAAAGRSLRTEERTERPQGLHTRFDWTLEHPGPADQDLLTHLSRWSTQIGRRQTTGYGSLHVQDVRAYTFDLDLADHLTWWLSDRASAIRQTLFSTELPVPDTATVAAAGAATTGQGTVTQGWRRDIPWKVNDPLHIGDSQEIDTDDPAADRKATTRRVRRQPGDTKHTRLRVMPGTGWKGIFRHRVEYILNTLDTDTDDAATITGVLFGHPGSAGRHPTPGRRGLLRFADSGHAMVPGHHQPATSGTTMTYHLAPWPHQDWAGTTATATGWNWLWMDLTGTTTATALPERPVLTSWLWGWRPAQWVRLRLDGGLVVGAVLTRTDPQTTGSAAGIEVQVVSHVVPRLAPTAAAGDVRPPTIALHEVLVPAVTFLDIPG
jgi:hypothetical protein